MIKNALLQTTFTLIITTSYTRGFPFISNTKHHRLHSRGQLWVQNVIFTWPSLDFHNRHRWVWGSRWWDSFFEWLYSPSGDLCGASLAEQWVGWRLTRILLSNSVLDRFSDSDTPSQPASGPAGLHAFLILGPVALLQLYTQGDNMIVDIPPSYTIQQTHIPKIIAQITAFSSDVLGFIWVC